MLEKIALILEQEFNLDLQKPIIVGVSGGPDSLCLLDLFFRLDYSIIVGHLDHKLRPESTHEARYVEKIAEAYGVDFLTQIKDIAQIAKKNKQSIEEAARIERYKFLFQSAVEHNAQAVAVGHTADDQVETVLMHLLRGAGSAGLRGIAFWNLPNSWSSTIPIIRPLLSTWREEIAQYLEDRKISPLIDASNMDPRYYRNRIRLDLIPYLESYNPNIRKLIFYLSQIIKDEHQYIDDAVERAWNSIVIEKSRSYFCFNHPALRQLPVALKRQVLRKAIQYLHPNLRDINFKALESARFFIEESSASQNLMMLAGLTMLVEGDWLWLYDQESGLPDDQWPQMENSLIQSPLIIPGELCLNPHWRLKTDILPISTHLYKTITHNIDPYSCWLDHEVLHTGLSIRARKSGDRYRPLGMKNHSAKVSDIMINHKIPRRARAKWPMIFSGDEIAWIPGFPPSQLYPIKKSTKTAIQIKLIKA